MLAHFRNTTRDGRTSVGWTSVWNAPLFWEKRAAAASKNIDLPKEKQHPSDVVKVEPITDREYRVEMGYTYPDGNKTKRSRHEN